MSINAHPITVMGASGHTGRAVATALLEAGEAVRVLGRSPQRLALLAAAGAEARAGDPSDAAWLADALRGSRAAYLLLPYDPQTPDYDAQQDELGAAIAQAVKDSGVSHIVALSSLGAELSEGNGPIASLHRQERRLRQTGANVLFLRCGAFYDNFAEALPIIREQGVLADAYAPDVLVPMIATADVGRAAAAALRRRDWRGVQVRELVGPRDLTHAQAAAIIGSAIGQPELRYVQVAYEAWIDILVASGMSSSVAGEVTDLARAINEGRVRSSGDLAAQRMPTTFEQYASGLAAFAGSDLADAVTGAAR